MYRDTYVIEDNEPQQRTPFNLPNTEAQVVTLSDSQETDPLPSIKAQIETQTWPYKSRS